MTFLQPTADEKKAPETSRSGSGASQRCNLQPSAYLLFLLLAPYLQHQAKDIRVGDDAHEPVAARAMRCLDNR